ncbi:hypothetical protein TSOC_008228, partial [Tetrabaena socialis]
MRDPPAGVFSSVLSPRDSAWAITLVAGARGGGRQEFKCRIAQNGSKPEFRLGGVSALLRLYGARAGDVLVFRPVPGRPAAFAVRDVPAAAAATAQVAAIAAGAASSAPGPGAGAATGSGLGPAGQQAAGQHKEAAGGDGDGDKDSRGKARAEAVLAAGGRAAAAAAGPGRDAGRSKELSPYDVRMGRMVVPRPMVTPPAGIFSDVMATPEPSRFVTLLPATPGFEHLEVKMRLVRHGWMGLRLGRMAALFRHLGAAAGDMLVFRSVPGRAATFAVSHVPAAAAAARPGDGPSLAHAAGEAGGCQGSGEEEELKSSPSSEGREGEELEAGASSSSSEGEEDEVVGSSSEEQEEEDRGSLSSSSEGGEEGEEVGGSSSSSEGGGEEVAMLSSEGQREEVGGSTSSAEEEDEGAEDLGGRAALRNAGPEPSQLGGPTAAAGGEASGGAAAAAATCPPLAAAAAGAADSGPPRIPPCPAVAAAAAPPHAPATQPQQPGASASRLRTPASPTPPPSLRPPKPLPASSLTAAHLRGCELRPRCPPTSAPDPAPPLAPGELRLCGLTFHPGLAPIVRGAMAAWEASLPPSLRGAGLADADPASQQLRLPAPSLALLAAHRVPPFIVAADTAQLLGLAAEWGAPLPYSAVQRSRLLAAGRDHARGGAGLFAAGPIKRGCALAVVGGYVMGGEEEAALELRGFRNCGEGAAAELLARAGGQADRVPCGWRLLEGALRLPLEGGLALLAAHRVPPFIVAADTAQLLGLAAEWGAPLPYSAVQRSRLLAARLDPARGGAGLFAAGPIKRGCALAVVGGYVMGGEEAAALELRGFRNCGEGAAAELLARAGGQVDRVPCGWRLLEGALRLPLEGGSLGAVWGLGGEGVEGERGGVCTYAGGMGAGPRQGSRGWEECGDVPVPGRWALSMLGYGNLAALVNDPRAQPRGWEEGHDVEGEAAAGGANCAVVPVVVRGVGLPVLVALRDVAPGQQLLRDYGAAWWRGHEAAWGVAEHAGLRAAAVMHPRGALEGLAPQHEGPGEGPGGDQGCRGAAAATGGGSCGGRQRAGTEDGGGCGARVGRAWER